MSRSEYTANLKLANTVPAYKNHVLDGSLARKALENYYRDQPKGMAKIVDRLAKLFK